MQDFTLTIKISNVNDNPPVLGATAYTASVPIGTKVGAALTLSPTLQVTDKDDDDTAVTDKTYFRLISGGTFSQFLCKLETTSYILGVKTMHLFFEDLTNYMMMNVSAVVRTNRARLFSAYYQKMTVNHTFL